MEQTYQMKIIKLSPSERKIGLSIRALKSDEYRTDWETYSETTGRPEVTLGDHFRISSDKLSSFRLPASGTRKSEAGAGGRHRGRWKLAAGSWELAAGS